MVTDTHVGPRYADKAVASLKAAGFETHVVMVPAGEAAKSLKVVARCYDAFAKQRLERQSLEGQSQAGLARIRYEASAEISVSLQEDEICLSAKIPT